MIRFYDGNGEIDDRVSIEQRKREKGGRGKEKKETMEVTLDDRQMFRASGNEIIF